MARSQRSGFNNIQLRDLLKVIEDDEKKFLRVPYLLTGIQSLDIKGMQKKIDPMPKGHEKYSETDKDKCPFYQMQKEKAEKV